MKRVGLIVALLLSACSIESAQGFEPVANNAVALHGESIYSFAGISSGKTWQDVHAKAFKCRPDLSCESLAPLPDGKGRLAVTAQTVGDIIYIFGGYTVAEDHTEVSTPEVFAFAPKTKSYSQRAGIPVPVDDTVSYVYQDRYIYLISGWHKDTNVNHVQVYDTQTDSWKQATDWPGAPVFGHSGGGVGSVMAICDGVQIILPKDEISRHTFETISACWRGDIDTDDITKITWRRLPQLPGAGHYRMAATGVAERNLVLFAGGTANAYNYNGIGYNKIPSAPSAHVWGYDIGADKYVVFKNKSRATMDHRGLMNLGEGQFATLGGMGPGQTVLGSLDSFTID